MSSKSKKSENDKNDIIIVDSAEKGNKDDSSSTKVLKSSKKIKKDEIPVTQSAEKSGKKKEKSRQEESKDKKKAFRPKKLKNGEWVRRVMKCYKNAEGKIELPIINAVRTGEFMGYPYLQFGHYDFHYDAWITQLRCSQKAATSKKEKRWKPKDANSSYFIDDKKEVSKVMMELEQCGRQSDSEVERDDKSEDEQLTENDDE